jgi:hypothetical protein
MKFMKSFVLLLMAFAQVKAVPASSPMPSCDLDFTFINADADEAAPPYTNLDNHIFTELLGYEFNVNISGTPACHDDIEDMVITTVAPDFAKEQREGTAPYAAFGDDSGDYHGKSMVSGTYKMTAEAYNGDGYLLTEKTIMFSAEIPCIITFWLWDANKGAGDTSLIDDGVTFTVFPFLFSIEARPEGCANVRKVELEMTGPIHKIKTERSARYFIFGDSDGDVRGEYLKDGTYTVKAMVYDGRDEQLVHRTIEFTVNLRDSDFPN